MSTDHKQPFGLHHLTVIPENFDPATPEDTPDDG